MGMKTIATLFLAFFLFASSATAQVQERWNVRMGGTGEEGCYSALPTADGGFLLSGSSSSGVDGDKFAPSRGGFDYWVVKTDALGERQWDRTFGGLQDEELWISLTVPGGYLLGGFSYSGASGDKTEPSRGGADYWVLRLDEQGNILWDRRYGGFSHDWLYALTPTSDGGFLLGGASLSGAGGDKTQASNGGCDYWTVKIDGFGNKRWDRSYGGGSMDYLQGLLSTSDGGFLLGGHSFSGVGGDKSEPSRGGYDYWLVRTDALGEIVWDKRFGGNNDDYCYGLQATSEGEFLVGGYSFSGMYGDKSQPSRGGADFWLLKVDQNGKKVWEEIYGGTGDDRLYSLSPAGEDRFLLAGDSDSGQSGEKTEPSRGGFDGWAVEVDEQGILIWDKTLGGSGDDYVVPGFRTPDKGFLLAGGTRPAESISGIWDFWMAKTTANCADSPLSVQSEQVSASCPDATDGALIVSPGGGTAPYTYKWSNEAEAASVFDLRPGIYYLTLTETGGCEEIFSFEIGILPEPLTGEITPCQTVFYGYSPSSQCARVSVSVEGGCEPYTYAWSTGDTSEGIQVCPEETSFYFVTVTDDAGQSLVWSAEVEVLDIRCGNNLDRVMVCQTIPGNPDKTRTLSVPATAVEDHLAAGGYLGPCGWESCAGYSLALAISEGDLNRDIVLGYATGWEEPAAQPTLYLFPNPAGDYLIADLRSFPEGKYAITIFDRQGTALISRLLDVNDAVQWQADLSGYPTGLYWIQVRGDDVVVEQKFVVGNLVAQ